MPRPSFALYFVFAGVLNAASIVSVLDSDPDLPGNANIVSNTAFAMTWTQTGSFSNVVIQAAIGANLPVNSPNPQIVAFLTTAVGGPTTVANEIASASVAVPLSGDPHPMLTLLSIPTLGAGTYYLSVFHSSGGSPDWNFEPSASVTSDVGSTANANFLRATSPFAGYLPASDFTAQTFGGGFFTVTGDPSSTIPEPSTFALLGIGVLALALRRR